MKWNVLSQMLAALLVSIVASIFVLRYSELLARLSTSGILLLSLGLLTLAAALALGPSILTALLPSPQVITRFQRGALRVVTIGAFNLAAIVLLAAAIIALSSSAEREDALYRYIGSMLAIMGIGSQLAFVSGRIMSGVSSFSVWAILDQLWYPVLMLVVTVVLARQWSGEDISRWHLILSVNTGLYTLNYAFGFIHGYFNEPKDAA